MGENVNYRYSQTNPAPGHTPEFIERLPGEPLRYGRRFQNSLQAARLIGLKPDEADDHYNEVLDLCQQGRLVPMYDHPAVNALEVFARPGELLQAWETASGQKVTGVSQQRLSLPSSAVVPGGIVLQAFHTRTLTVLTGSQDSSQDSSVLSAVFLDRKLVAVLDHTQPEEQALAAAAAMTGRWTLQGGAVLERARQVQLKLDEQP